MLDVNLFNVGLPPAFLAMSGCRVSLSLYKERRC